MGQTFSERHVHPKNGYEFLPERYIDNPRKYLILIHILKLWRLHIFFLTAPRLEEPLGMEICFSKQFLFKMFPKILNFL